MNTIVRTFPPVLFFALLAVSGLQAQQPASPANSKGAIIILTVEGNLRIRDTSTREYIPQENVIPGRYIYDGYTAITGSSSKAVFLLTNGSLTTLGEKSEMDFAQFTQAKFVNATGSVAQLKEEPSQSTTKLRLGYGDMVFNVKKLKPGSVFQIDSPIGNAGIRGTDGKVSVQFDPQSGNFSGSVNMLSGMVQFTDPSNHEIRLPAGEAVTVNATPAGVQVGETSHVRVEPEVTQEMQVTKQEAEAKTENIQLSDVSTVVEEVEKILENVIQPREEPADEPKDPRPEDEKPAEAGTTKEDTAAGTDESASTTTSETQTEPTTPETTKETSSSVSQAAKVDTAQIVDQNNETDETISYIHAGLSSALIVQLKSYSPAMREKILSESSAQARYLLSMAATEKQLEYYYSFNDPFRHYLSSSVLPAQTKTLLAHQLPQADIESILTYAANVRDLLINEPLSRIQTFLAFKLDGTEAGTFFQFSVGFRDALFGLGGESPVKALLGLGKPEAETAAWLASMSDREDLLAQTDTLGKSPTEPDPSLDDVISDSVSQLLVDSRANGNEYIFNILLDEGQGTLDDTLLAKGILGNALLTDTSVSGSLPTSQIFPVEEALGNQFYHKVAGLIDSLEPTLLTGFALASKHLYLHPGTIEIDVQAPFYITAAEGIGIDGQVSLQNTGQALPDLYLGSGEAFSFAPGSSLSYNDGALHLASRSSSDFMQVSMESGGNLNITSLENLLFQDASLKVPAGDSIHLQASYNLSVNGLQFSNQVQEIYMQAITIDLRNVFFPNGSMVHLQSQFGGIDGIYPNFGSSQVGRVNFIDNVGYNTTVIQDRATFDQFRDKIQISPIGMN
jgi:hypothetical protein